MTTKKHIMVVDDEQDICLVMKFGLEKYDFVVDTFTDPVVALDQFKPGKYDLVLLDVKMPQMTGFELYGELNSLDAKVRVCFITAFEFYYEEFGRMFPKLQVGCFVRKPVMIEQLARIIEDELKRTDTEDVSK